MWDESSVPSADVNFQKICRTCMEAKDDLIFIFDSCGKYDNRPIHEMVFDCTSLEMHKDDGLPLKICSQCIQRVEEAYLFRLQAERCHSALQTIISDRLACAKICDDAEIKQEIVKDELNDFVGDDFDGQLSDESDDTQPLSCMKKNRTLLYNCKFCEFGSTDSEDILTHLVTAHKSQCGLDTIKTRGRPSQQDVAERKAKLQTTFHRFITTSDVESKVDLKLEVDHLDGLNTQSAYPQLKVGEETNKRLKKQSKHIKEKIWECEMCGKTFSKLGHLNRHKLKFHGREDEDERVAGKKEKNHSCTSCSKAFYRQEQLERHYKTHLPREKKYHCPDCPKKYDRQDKLKFHSRVHVINKAELESNFLCVYCGHGFSNSSNLIVHLRRHTGEKPYKCDICQKGFPRSTDLLNHRIIHTGEKPCVCKVCGKAFSHQHKLVRHERIHTGHKPFKCNLCDRAFTQSNDLTLHIRRHTGDKPYVCSVCGDRFYLNTVLQGHKRTHGHYDARELAELTAKQTEQQKLQKIQECLGNVPR